jgi:DNA-binding transcriptional MerR regulator/methylmalonyl-CoA mutase cobalamin-binding subunit
MKSVVQRTGLSPHVIRVWEKRYGAVAPRRTPSNRRLYSDAEVRRLLLLHAATKAGHSIGTIARLSDEQLRALTGWAEESPPVRNHINGHALPGDPSGGFLAATLDAVRRMDARACEAVLMRASLELGSQGLLQKLIAPLTGKLGDLWQAGELTAAEEHFASAVVRSFLANLARPFALPEHAPGLVVATPAGQLHELGAILVAAAASGHGWRVTYLGTSLPAVEIAGAASRAGARALALSIVYPADDPQLPGELQALKRFLPESLAIVAGGRAAAAYKPALDAIGAVLAEDLRGLYAFLDSVRQPNGTPAPNGAPAPAR